MKTRDIEEITFRHSYVRDGIVIIITRWDDKTSKHIETSYNSEHISDSTFKRTVKFAQHNYVDSYSEINRNFIDITFTI